MDWVREAAHEGEPGGADAVHRLCRLSAEAGGLGDHGLAVEALLTAALRCWWSNPGADIRRAVRDAILAQHAYRPDPRLLAARALTEAGQVPTARDRRGLGNDVWSSDPEALRLSGFAAHALGDAPRAVDQLSGAESILRREGAVGRLFPVLVTLATNRLFTGDWVRAEAAIQEARRVGDGTGQPIWDTALLVCRAHSAALRGQLTDALELAGRAELMATQPRVTALLEAVQLAKGCAWAAVGRFPEAYLELRHLFGADEPGDHARLRYPALMFLAEAAAHAGQRPEALEIIARWVRLAGPTPAPDLLVHLRYAQAVLADDEVAEELYEVAMGRDVDAWPFVKAMVQASYGGWLRRQRRVVESRQLTRAAVRTFDLIGARGWAARARSELAAAGSARRRRPRRSGRC